MSAFAHALFQDCHCALAGDVEVAARLPVGAHDLGETVLAAVMLWLARVAMSWGTSRRCIASSCVGVASWRAAARRATYAMVSPMSAVALTVVMDRCW